MEVTLSMAGVVLGVALTLIGQRFQDRRNARTEKHRHLRELTDQTLTAWSDVDDLLSDLRSGGAASRSEVLAASRALATCLRRFDLVAVEPEELRTAISQLRDHNRRFRSERRSDPSPLAPEAAGADHEAYIEEVKRIRAIVRQASPE